MKRICLAPWGMLPLRLRRNECLLLSVYLVCVPLLVTQFWQDEARSYRTPRQQGGELETATLMTVEHITSGVLPKHNRTQHLKAAEATNVSKETAGPSDIFRNGSVFQTNRTLVDTPEDILNFFNTLESKTWRFSKKRVTRFRFNFPRVSRPYVKDIGIRTHLLACNAGIIDRNFKRMHSLSRNWLQKYQSIFRIGKFGKSTLLAFPFMVPGGHQRRVVKMQQVIQAQRISNKARISL
uniref:Uncharacterized protein n=1 Tax=Branchiostoma floridae TaxID=7739 RepID=C3Y3X9_BRAFL|eukprot:XP_002608995.1 hypothetical protein BRAFLDRAFT_84801 [Branchiostoma floridae]